MTGGQYQQQERKGKQTTIRKIGQRGESVIKNVVLSSLMFSID